MGSWADQILALSPAERASTRAFSPFIPDPESGRLHLINEMRRGRRDGSGFAIAPSRGWVEPAPGIMIWCALGAEDILAGQKLPGRVVSPVGVKIDLRQAAWESAPYLQVILELISSGKGFVFCGDLFLLPTERYAMNSFSYDLTPEPLDVFIGYRGHMKRYAEILTPSVYRMRNSPSPGTFAKYKRRATYAGNVVRQTFWEQQAVALDNLRACGLLQHHGTVGPTDILDLSYDLDVAKWFALNRLDPTTIPPWGSGLVS